MDTLISPFCVWGPLAGLLKEGKYVASDSIWLSWWAHVPVSTHRIGVVKCKAHQRAEASGFIAVWSTVVCLQALEMFELDLLEHISAWKLCKLTVRKLICVGGVKTSAAAGSELFMSSTQSDSSIYSHVSSIKRPTLVLGDIYFFLSVWHQQQECNPMRVLQW